MPLRSAGDREEMSTTQCIDFNQSGELRKNRRRERKLGLKHYVIRHRVWRFLQEKICKGLEERDRVFFKENCVESERVGMCACWRARFLFAVSASSVCLCYKKGVTVCTPTCPVLDIM